jgi:uncharacterized Ntn-hydrolase superfamily protein
MTFSIVGRCERTGMTGVAIATRPMAIGAKCPFVRPHIGGLVVQANGDPRLGALGLRLLEMGYSARKVLDELKDSDGPERIEWRQIGVVDRDGRSAAHTGSNNEDWAGHVARRNVVACGNRLVNERVCTVMAERFEASGKLDLADRLLLALEDARDAGGQVAGQHSAALLVYHQRSYAWVDLRSDEHDEPIGELRRLYTLYVPLMTYYDQRPNNPSMPRDDDWRKELGIAGGPR